MDRGQPKHWDIRSRERHWIQLRQYAAPGTGTRHSGLARNRPGWHCWSDSSALRLLTVVPLLRENPGDPPRGFCFEREHKSASPLNAGNAARRLPRCQFLLQMRGDLLAVEAAILDEDFIRPRSRNNHSGHIDSRHIAL